MADLICKLCGDPREVGRRLCVPCNKKRLLESTKNKPRYMFEKTCAACSKDFKAFRKICVICPDCYKQSRRKNSSTNGYVYEYSGVKGNSNHQHRRIAEHMLGKRLTEDEVVHHINEDPRDNRRENLLLMTRSDHGSLHSWLDTQRVIFEKSKNENSENCWKTLIVSKTTAWLEMTSAKVIKIWEIGQSAAEPLKEKSQEEGSETMHGTSVTSNVVEDDIVQTTTALPASEN